MEINELNLEKFSGYGSKVSRKISITNSYSFGIPPAFFREHKLGAKTHVILFYDRQAQVIAFKFMEDESEGGFKLVNYGTGDKQGASFVARSFFNTYKINPAKYKGRYDVHDGQKEGLGKIFWIEIGDRPEDEQVSAAGIQ